MINNNNIEVDGEWYIMLEAEKPYRNWNSKRDIYLKYGEIGDIHLIVGQERVCNIIIPSYILVDGKMEFQTYTTDDGEMLPNAYPHIFHTIPERYTDYIEALAMKTMPEYFV